MNFFKHNKRGTNIKIMLKKLKVSTAVIVGSCSCEFDIDAIYNGLDITDEITSIKCNNKQKLKSKEINCKTFYNQISISIKNKANVKIFANGKFQISGVKSLDSAKENIDFLFNMIKDIKGKITTKPEFYKGLYVYKNKIISKNDKGDYIYSNVIKNGKIIINNNLVEPFDEVKNTYIQCTHKDKMKILYDGNCKEVGHVEYIMTRKNKNLCIKGCTYEKISDNVYKIVNKYKNEKGEMHVHLNKIVEIEQIPEEIDIVYSACNSTPSILEMYIANINTNTGIILSKDEYLDRDAICSYLSEKNINVIYDPSRYSGIKFALNDSKITIFRTGSILLSSKMIDMETYNFLQKMFEENQFYQIKQEETYTGNLTIWDM